MKNKKIIIIAIILIIIIILAFLGYLYLKTDFLKTNQQLFYKYLSKVQVSDSNLAERYMLLQNKKMKNNNSSTMDLNFSSVIKNPQTQVADIQTIFKIKSNALENVELKQSYRDFTISNNEAQIARIKYLKDGNVYALTADNILNKYVSVENSNLKQLFSKIGVNDTTKIPDVIPDNYEELLKVDNTTIETLKQTYGELIYKNINKENYYKVDNKDGTQILGLSLTEQETANIAQTVLEKAKNDDTLLNLIINKAKLLGYTVTNLDIQAEIQKYIDELLQQTYSNEKDFLNVSLLKKEKDIIKINIQLNEDITMNNANAQSEKAKKVIEVDISQVNQIIMSIKEQDTEIIKFVYGYSYNDNDMNINMELINNTESKDLIKMQLQINNYQTDNITENSIININSENSVEYQINISNNITIKQDVQIEKLTTANSAKLNDMTAQDISNFFKALQSRITTLYGAQIYSMFTM